MRRLLLPLAFAFAPFHALGDPNAFLMRPHGRESPAGEWQLKDKGVTFGLNPILPSSQYRLCFDYGGSVRLMEDRSVVMRCADGSVAHSRWTMGAVGTSPTITFEASPPQTYVIHYGMTAEGARFRLQGISDGREDLKAYYLFGWETAASGK